MVLPCGIIPSENAFKGYKTKDGLYVFPNAYEGTYDYFGSILADKPFKQESTTKNDDNVVME